MFTTTHEYVSFLKTFKEEKNNHRIVSFSDTSVINFYKMKKQVCALYTYFKNIESERVVINTKNPYYLLIIVLSCAFAKKNLYEISLIPNHTIDLFLEKEENFFTDNKIIAQNQKSAILLNTLLDDLDVYEYVELPDFDPAELLVCITEYRDSNEFFINKRTLLSIEKEINASLSILPSLESGYMFACTELLNIGFFLSFGVLLSFLARGSIYTSRFISQKSLTRLVSTNYILVTSCDFLRGLNSDLFTPSPRFVIFNGKIVSPTVTMLAAETLKSDLFQFIGSLEIGCFGYSKVLKSSLIHIFDDIDYTIDNKDSSLVITKNFSEEKSINTNIVVSEKGDALEFIGDRLRCIYYKGLAYYLDDIEYLINSNSLIKNSVALEIIGDNLEVPTLGLLVELSPEHKEKINNVDNKNDLISDLRYSLKKILPDEILPNKIRIIDKIEYTNYGAVNYLTMQEHFSYNLSE